jgi:hypothetical protein
MEHVYIGSKLIILLKHTIKVGLNSNYEGRPNGNENSAIKDVK